MKQKLFLLAATALLIFRPDNVPADIMINNLNQIWPGKDMGDFHGIFPGEGIGFMFGTGANPYALNSVSFEVLGGTGGAQVAIYAVQGDPLATPNPNLTLAGTLGNPVADAKPTQWPGYTTFIDWTPTTAITLAPNTLYLIGVTEPANGTGTIALTYNFNDSYDLGADWSIDQSAPSGWTYYKPQPPPGFSGWMPNSPDSIMLQVNATPAPEPGSTASLLLGGALLARRGIRRFGGTAKPQGVR